MYEANKKGCERTFQTNSELEAEAMRIYSEEGKIQAIKFWRDRTACGLKESKEKIESLVGEVRMQREMSYCGKVYERTGKYFDLTNLVNNMACPDGLSEVLNYFGNSIYSNQTDESFRNWFIHGGGARHTSWLRSNGYIAEKRTPKEIVEECLGQIHDVTHLWVDNINEPDVTIQQINHLIETMQEELRRK